MPRNHHRQSSTTERYLPLDRRRPTAITPSEGICLRLSVTQLVLLCLCVAVLVQLALPVVQRQFKLLTSSTSSVQSSPQSLVSSLLCSSGLISDGLKTTFLSCPSPQSNLAPYNRLRANSGAVGAFFDDPLVVEPWDTRQEGEEAVSSDLAVAYQAPSPQRDNKWLEMEAIQALQAARRNRLEGNLLKAKVIIEHAYSLASHHPDVLTEYGIFMVCVGVWLVKVRTRLVFRYSGDLLQQRGGG